MLDCDHGKVRAVVLVEDLVMLLAFHELESDLVGTHSIHNPIRSRICSSNTRAQ